MDKQKQIEAMAVLDGYQAGDKTTFPQYFYKGSEIFTMHNQGGQPQLPDYLASNDAVQAVIDGLDYSDLIDYRETLYDFTEFAREYDHHKATPAQKVEAILKAKGLWEED